MTPLNDRTLLMLSVTPTVMATWPVTTWSC